jgi:hypothetical protein
MRTATTTTTFLLGLLALGLGACAMTTQQDTMNTWLGTTDAHLMAAWGAPDRESTAGGGFRVLTYMKVQEDSDGWPQVCRSSFTVDGDHLIVAATYYCG